MSVFVFFVALALGSFVLAALPKLAELIGANIRWEWAGIAFLVVALWLI